MGNIPKSIRVLLVGSTVDTCSPGDQVIVRGIVMQHWKSNRSLESELVLHANTITVISIEDHFRMISFRYSSEVFERFWKRNQKDVIAGRNKIVRSFCPALMGGLYYVKLSLALCLIGSGLERKYIDGYRTTSMRPDSHLLLAGDPGTGKSEVLRFVKEVTPRCVMTSGTGSTAAGLTVAAIKENSSDWQLEAGALVLADCGVCCIDDFSSIRVQERASVHEAMEQQSVSVAKAGMVCQVRSRCTVIAACSHLDKEFESLSDSLDIGNPLLSRFDIVLILNDNEIGLSNSWTKQLCQAVLNGHAGTKTKGNLTDDGFWPLSRLKAYIMAAKTRPPCEMTNEANDLINKYYCYRRQSEMRDISRTSVRLLESLIRLSHAHARLMFKCHVTTFDVVAVIELLEITSQSSDLLLETRSPLKTDFPINPKDQYRSATQRILRHGFLFIFNERELNDINKLNMNHLNKLNELKH
ncbi:hypothetical protein ACOME3_006069 [Neoechinorhynchus agilis]